MFPKLWNEIEIDLKETKSAKIFKQRVINIYLRIMRGLKAKNLAVYRVNKFYTKTKLTETLLTYFCFCNYHH